MSARTFDAELVVSASQVLYEDNRPPHSMQQNLWLHGVGRGSVG